MKAYQRMIYMARIIALIQPKFDPQAQTKTDDLVKRATVVSGKLKEDAGRMLYVLNFIHTQQLDKAEELLAVLEEEVK